LAAQRAPRGRYRCPGPETALFYRVDRVLLQRTPSLLIADRLPQRA
jgi:hypothetical protein